MDEDLGLCQAGNAPVFQEVFDDLYKQFPTGITYAEIGVGSGGTLLWAARYMKEHFKDWRAIGIDLPGGYSFCAHSVVNRCAGNFFVRFITEEVRDIENPKPWYALANGVTLVFAPSQAVFRRFWPKGLPLHCVLIDGCHGRSCVVGDFLSVEPLVEEGGYVLFHDYGQDSVGEFQPHCGVGDTWGAIEDLRLIYNNRPGWKFVKHNIADKTKDGRDLGVYKRVPKEISVPGSDSYRKFSGT